MKFTVDLERVVEITVPNDRHAALVADFIDSAVDRALREVRAEVELLQAHTQAYRGKSGRCIYDSQDESVRP